MAFLLTPDLLLLHLGLLKLEALQVAPCLRCKDTRVFRRSTILLLLNQLLCLLLRLLRWNNRLKEDLVSKVPLHLLD